jgi:hypothetical protein
MKMCDPLRSSRRASLPSLGSTTVTLWFRSTGSERAACGPELVSRCPTGRIRGSRRVSQVPGEPDVSMPCSPTPADQRARPLQHVNTAPAHSTTKAHTRGNFGAQSHGFDTGCLRFVRCLATRDARLASGRWPSSTGWDWIPIGFLRKVSDHSSPLPKLFLAQ